MADADAVVQRAKAPVTREVEIFMTNKFILDKFQGYSERKQYPKHRKNKVNPEKKKNKNECLRKL
jgi:hypothetical protein